MATHRMTSVLPSASVYSRMYARMRRLLGVRVRRLPRPKAFCCLRTASMRRVQFSSECGSLAWASTLTVW
ncbi:hypothetical protein D3C76_830920 [compost metagenome]